MVRSGTVGCVGLASEDKEAGHGPYPTRPALQQAAAKAAASQGRRRLPPARRIAIVGAGLAGLTCAYELKQAGQTATVYEASDRVGGRSWTLRGAFADNQLVERGGQLIDQSHTAIRQLTARLDLQIDNLLQAEPNGSEPLYHFDGQPYSYGQATNDLKAIYQKLHSDLSAASYPTLYNSFTPRGQQLDQMSILDWLDESVPGGARSKLGQLLEVAYTIEYGADAGQQSALNLLYLLGFSGQGQLRIFGMASSATATGRDWGATARPSPTPATRTPGRSRGPRGAARASWSTTPAGRSGTPAVRAQQFLAQLEPVLPGITAKWNGRATVDFWLGNPWTKGSYSFWKVGQYTRFAGVEREPEGNCHFAGEHTSVDFQGYLNGAVETGQRAAQELLSA